MVIRRLNLRFFRYEISIVRYLKAFDSNNKFYITWHISLYRRTQLEISLLIFYRLVIRHFFRTINFRQFRKKYALPNDRVFSFANLYIKCIFVNIFNHFLQQGSMPAYIDMIISLKVCGAEVSCYYSLECIE